MPDESTRNWHRAIEILSASPDFGPGKVSMLRMTRVLDVDGTLVLVVGSGFAKDVIERARRPIQDALAQVAGHAVPFETMIDTSAETSSPAFGSAQPGSQTATIPAATAPIAPTVDHRDEPARDDAVERTDPSASQPSPASSPYPTTAAPSASDLADLAARTADRTERQARAGASGYATSSPTFVAPPSQSAGAGSTGSSVDGSRLNPRYTFETYVQGASNRMARTAAFAVAEAPGRSYNPLFIYGGSGLGKTHLLHAIGNYARSLYPGIRVMYVSSEEFLSDFIASVADGHMDSFKDRYRNVDILLVDDIQFLGDKEQTLEEFFHTFNVLHTANKQIVLSSDVAPKYLKGFEERLSSRFVEGLTADVQPPDLETRAAILSRKARAEGLDLPDDVLYYIASRVSTNIRELEGALIRVTAFASLTQQPVDQTLAEMVLKDIISDTAAQEITPVLIMAQTADYFDVTIDDLCSKNRSKKQTHARHIAMYLCRELTDLSLPKIGKEFGGRDHTTVINANKNIARELGEERATYNQVAELTARIKQAAQQPQR